MSPASSRSKPGVPFRPACRANALIHDLPEAEQLQQTQALGPNRHEGAAKDLACEHPERRLPPTDPAVLKIGKSVTSKPGNSQTSLSRSPRSAPLSLPIIQRARLRLVRSRSKPSAALGQDEMNSLAAALPQFAMPD